MKIGRISVTGLRRLPAFARFGPGSVLEVPILGVSNPGGIEIGGDVTIRSYAFLEAISSTQTVTMRIGRGTYIGYFARITALSDVSIGAGVLISDRVYISDTGHNYEDTSELISKQGLRCGRRVHIADGAWIGIGAAIVGNVSIGRGAVVGANAVLTTDLPDYAVAAGNPARIVRHHDGEDWRSGAPR